MSASAINPASSPAPCAAQPGAPKAGHATQSVTGKGPLGPFEALLAALSDIQGLTVAGAADGATGTVGAKTAVKATAGDGKTAGGDGEAKTADDGAPATTAADATTATVTPDPSLLLLAPVPLGVPVQATAATAPAADSAAQAPAANVAAVQADQTAAATLAKLAGAQPDAGANQIGTTAFEASGATAALAADVLATDAAANTKATALAPPAAGKADAVQATPQPIAQTPPAAAAPPPAASPAAAGALPAAQTPPVAPAAEARPAEPAPAAGKERVQAIKTAVRVDVTKVGATAGAAAALTAKAADALQTVAQSDPKGGPGDEEERAPLLDTPAESRGASQAPADATATASTTTPATLIQTAAVAVRGAPQTVAALAAQIVKKLDGRSSQFDVQLDPAGLGKVDVRIAIGADGRMSAAMSFDTPQAAAELRARAGELHHAMEQAGFDLTGGMTFDVAGDRGQGGGQAQQQQPEAGAAFRGRAFQAALDTAADAGPAPQLTLRRTALSGVDIRI